MTQHLKRKEVINTTKPFLTKVSVKLMEAATDIKCLESQK